MVGRTANQRGEGEQLRDDLVSAATELLLSPQQLSVPSLRAIARKVGVSPSGVYLHFASQDDLIAAVVERQYADLGQALAAADRPGTAPRSRLVAMAQAYVAWGLTHPGAYQLLFESADALPAGAPAVSAGDALMDAVTLLVREHSGRPPAKARGVAMRIWMSLHGLVSLRIHKPHASWESSAARDAEAVVRVNLP